MQKGKYSDKDIDALAKSFFIQYTTKIIAE
jgi:hypothetical protein